MACRRPKSGPGTSPWTTRRVTVPLATATLIGTAIAAKHHPAGDGAAFGSAGFNTTPRMLPTVLRFDSEPVTGSLFPILNLSPYWGLARGRDSAERNERRKSLV